MFEGTYYIGDLKEVIQEDRWSPLASCLSFVVNTFKKKDFMTTELFLALCKSDIVIEQTQSVSFPVESGTFGAILLSEHTKQIIDFTKLFGAVASNKGRVVMLEGKGHFPRVEANADGNGRFEIGGLVFTESETTPWESSEEWEDSGCYSDDYELGEWQSSEVCW